MSSRARRIARSAHVAPFPWAEAAVLGAGADLLETDRRPRAPEPPSDSAEDRARLAELEREAFATAYAQGERAGLEAGATRAEAMLRRLADTLQQLEDLRRSMIRQTERQVVQLAIEMARRILRREVETDNDLLCAMARVALDRLGETAAATIRLNPEDYHTIVARHGGTWAGTHVTVVADPAVGRGGCLVDSAFGFVDASVDAQFRVLEEALLSEDGLSTAVEAHGRG